MPNVTRKRYSDVSLWSAAYGRRREVLQLRKERDLMTGIAASNSRKQILEITTDGLIALGAAGVACWSCTAMQADLLHGRGARLDGSSHVQIKFEQVHPVTVCARDKRPRWILNARAVASEFADWVPGGYRGSLGFIPILCADSVMTVMAVGYHALPTERARQTIENLLGHVGRALWRTRVASELLERRDAELRLLAIVSHDLRNPLNTILLAASRISLETSNELRTVARRVTRAAQQVSSLTTDLLTSARLENSGTLSLDLQHVDLYESVATAVSDAQARITGERSLTLERMGASGEALVQVDAARIEQAIGNLISNALAHSPTQSQSFVRYSCDSHAVYIEFENRGRKVDLAYVATLFDPMVRSACVGVGERGSVGLGLFIVKQIMDAHGGRVWFEWPDPDGVRVCLQFYRSIVAPSGLPELSLSPTTRWPDTAGASPTTTAHAMLLPNMQTAKLVAVLALWSRACLTGLMPHPLSLSESALLGYLPEMIALSVQIDHAGLPVFHVDSQGARLEQSLHGTLVGDTFAKQKSGTATSLYEAYYRCWRLQRCTYDYLRERTTTGFSFERLLMPLSADGVAVTHIIGIVLMRSGKEASTCQT